MYMQMINMKSLGHVYNNKLSVIIAVIILNVEHNKIVFNTALNYILLKV